MSSRDVSAAKIMRVRPFIISFVCVGLVLLFCIGAEAEAQSGGTTIGVNCAKGGSINNALKLKADPLTIEIRGECHEDVVISRNNVTLRGVDPNAKVVAASNQAIWVDRASRVTLENLTVTGSTHPDIFTGAGIFLFHSSGVILSNVKAEGNYQGMRTYGSTLRIVDSDFSRNSWGGVYIAGGSSLFIDGEEINTSANGNFGFLVSESTVRESYPACPRVVANDNVGPGVALQGPASVGLGGPFEAKRNGTGISVIGGHLEIQGSVVVSENQSGVVASGSDAEVVLWGGERLSVSGNVGTGLDANDAGYIYLYGTLAENGTAVCATGAGRVYLYATDCQNNGFGVLVHGGTALIQDSTITDTTNGADVALSFGARVSFDGENHVGTVTCDDTVLVEGDVSCPATTSVTVNPLQIERVAPKGRQPIDRMAPRWIP